MASPSYEDQLEFFSIKALDGPLTSRRRHLRETDRILIGRKPTGTLLIDNLLPGRMLYLLMALTRPGGWLAVMTCFQTEDARFRNWHYRKDPTHVVFYCEETLRHIASLRGWSCDVPVKDVALMQRPAPRTR